jgi:hypothetical protein
MYPNFLHLRRRLYNIGSYLGFLGRSAPTPKTKLVPIIGDHADDDLDFHVEEDYVNASLSPGKKFDFDFDFDILVEYHKPISKEEEIELCERLYASKNELGSRLFRIKANRANLENKLKDLNVQIGKVIEHLTEEPTCTSKAKKTLSSLLAKKFKIKDEVHHCTSLLLTEHAFFDTILGYVEEVSTRQLRLQDVPITLEQFEEINEKLDEVSLYLKNQASTAFVEVQV